MADSFEGLICFLVWPLPETAMGTLCDRLVGGLRCTTLRDTIYSPRAEFKVLLAAQTI